MSSQLATVGKQMAEKYDLSEETAKAKSAGVKGFRSQSFWMPKVLPSLGDISETARWQSIATFHIGAAMTS